MVGRVGEDLVAVNALRPRGLLRKAGGGHRHVEHLEDGRALGAGIGAVAAEEVVRGDAPLAVGGPGQGDHGRLAGDKVRHLHRVAHGVDVRVLRAHVVVHLDAAARVAGQAAVPGQRALRPHADAQHDQVRGDLALRRADEARLRAGDRGVQQQVDALGAHIVVHVRRHVQVQRGDEVVRHLHDRDLQARVREVFRHLHADVAAAHDHDLCARLALERVHGRLDAQRVRDVAQGVDGAAIQAGKVRHEGRRARGDEELVIRLGIGSAARLAHGDRMGRAVDLRDLAVHAHVHVEARAEALGRLQGQVVLVGDDAAHVVRQSAIRKGDERAALQQEDLGLFVQAPGARRRRGPAGNAADDDQFHVPHLQVFFLPPLYPIPARLNIPSPAIILIGESLWKEGAP